MATEWEVQLDLLSSFQLKELVIQLVKKNLDNQEIVKTFLDSQARPSINSYFKSSPAVYSPQLPCNQSPFGNSDASIDSFESSIWDSKLSQTLNVMDEIKLKVKQTVSNLRNVDVDPSSSFQFVQEQNVQQAFSVLDEILESVGSLLQQQSSASTQEAMEILEYLERSRIVKRACELDDALTGSYSQEMKATCWFLWSKCLQQALLTVDEKKEWANKIMHFYGSEFLPGSGEWLLLLLNDGVSKFMKNPKKYKRSLFIRLCSWIRTLLKINKAEYYEHFGNLELELSIELFKVDPSPVLFHKIQFIATTSSQLDWSSILQELREATSYEIIELMLEDQGPSYSSPKSRKSSSRSSK